MHFAVLQENIQLVELLLSKNASALIQDTRGRNPLHLACEKGMQNIFSSIVSAQYHAKYQFANYVVDDAE